MDFCAHVAQAYRWMIGIFHCLGMTDIVGSFACMYVSRKDPHIKMIHIVFITNRVYSTTLGINWRGEEQCKVSYEEEC